MTAITRLYYRNFIIAALITLLVAAVSLYISFTMGKGEFFLLLNNDLGKAGDIFFNYFTHAGDGLLWLVWLAAIFKTRRKHLLPLLIAAFALSTIFSQLGKQLIYPEEIRPSEAFKIELLGVQMHDEVKTINGVQVETRQEIFREFNRYDKGDSVTIAFTRAGQADTAAFILNERKYVHLVDGITLHTYNSFPSGHTATAFVFAFLIVLLLRSPVWIPLALLAAVLVGYTRIYQGQHYPLDVAAGMIVAVLSVALALPIQHWFDKRRINKSTIKA